MRSQSEFDEKYKGWGIFYHGSRGYHSAQIFKTAFRPRWFGGLSRTTSVAPASATVPTDMDTTSTTNDDNCMRTQKDVDSGSDNVPTSAAAAAAITSDKDSFPLQPDGDDGDGDGDGDGDAAAVVRVTPSIIYCAHPEFSDIWQKPDGSYVQMVLQCRVNPDAIACVERERLLDEKSSRHIDPNFPNAELEYVLKCSPDKLSCDDIVCYGIMVRKLPPQTHPVNLPESGWWRETKGNPIKDAYMLKLEKKLMDMCVIS